MPSLSLDKAPKDGMLVAIVKGGDNDGEILTVHTEEDKQSKSPKKEINAIRYTKDLKGLTPAKRVALFNRLSEAKERGISPKCLWRTNISKSYTSVS
jgi:hypothetical protein